MIKAYAQLIAIAVLKRLPDRIARPVFRFLDRWIGPTHPDAAARLRREMAGAFAKAFASLDK